MSVSNSNAGANVQFQSPIIFPNAFNTGENLTFNGAGLSTAAIDGSYAATIMQYGAGQLNFGDVGDGGAVRLGIGAIAFQVKQTGGTIIFQAGITQVALFQANSVSFFADSILFSSNGDIQGAQYININTGRAVIDINSLIRDVNGVAILNAQQPAIVNATNAADVITRANAILTALRSHGLIAP